MFSEANLVGGPVVHGGVDVQGVVGAPRWGEFGVPEALESDGQGIGVQGGDEQVATHVELPGGVWVSGDMKAGSGVHRPMRGNVARVGSGEFCGGWGASVGEGVADAFGVCVEVGDDGGGGLGGVGGGIGGED